MSEPTTEQAKELLKRLESLKYEYEKLDILDKYLCDVWESGTQDGRELERAGY